MFRICRIGMVFLKNSKMLTFSAFLSIFLACFLSISMFQLSTSAEVSYENDILEEYGDYDIGLTKEDGTFFINEEEEIVENTEGVKAVSIGYYIASLEGIYTVGVKDDYMNKSRYKYTYNIEDNDVVINSCLSEKYGKKVGDTFSLGGQDYIVREVLEGDSFSKSKMYLAIMDMERLQTALEYETGNQPNYMLLQCEEGADLENITEQLHMMSDGKFEVICIGQDEDFQKMLMIFKGLLLVLFVIVVFICGMFILSIFQEYIRKYQRDMAIIRTVGGKRWQVNCIFLAMSVMLSISGCVTGSVACAILDDFLLNCINDKLHLFQGEVVMDWKIVLEISCIIFCVFNLFITILFLLKQRVLPIQIFQETSTGLRKKKKGNCFLVTRKLFKTEGYLAIKLLMPKFWQNFMIIVIIALITALAYTGQASINLLNENNFHYYRDLMNGAEACAELYTDDVLDVDKVESMEKEIESVSDQSCYLLGSFYNSEKNISKEFSGFYVADLNGFMEQFPGERMKDWNEVPREQRVIMTERTAEYSGYELGNKITLDTEWLGGKTEFTIVEIVSWNYYIAEDEGIILEQDNLLNIKKNTLCPSEAYFYVNGYREETEAVFQKFETKETEFHWLSMEGIIKEGKEISNQRLTMICVVMFILIVVAGIGWLNSAKAMLVARKEEYQVLRMLGTMVKRVRRICWFQVWSYMLAGIVLGIIMGLLVVYFLWRSNVNSNVSISIYWENVLGIILYLFSLSLLLKPTIKKLAE
ncbi:MAG: ABC transporter permease [Lachnospiraceae bacterium]|nr:ABC transporter permease [Lachnospiraceae bacterium]